MRLSVEFSWKTACSALNLSTADGEALKSALFHAGVYLYRLHKHVSKVQLENGVLYVPCK